MVNCFGRWKVTSTIVTRAEAALRPQRYSPGKTESHGFDGHKQSTTVVHTDYTARRKRSSDDKSNTTFRVHSINASRFVLPAVVRRHLLRLLFLLATLILLRSTLGALRLAANKFLQTLCNLLYSAI